MKQRIPFVCLILFILGGCATKLLPTDNAEQDYDSLYLRGVFTWWEADENYRVTDLGDDRYGATVKLIADGQPYDFKFADKHWTPGLSCGSSQGEQSMPITRYQMLLADCDNPQGNFQFTPDETGEYTFVIDFSEPTSPLVSVVKA